MKIPIGNELPKQAIKTEVKEQPKEVTQNTGTPMDINDLLFKIRALTRQIKDLEEQINRKRVLLIDERKINKEMSMYSARNLLDEMNLTRQIMEMVVMENFRISKDELKEMKEKCLETWEWEI